jgi:MFS family permease
MPEQPVSNRQSLVAFNGHMVAHAVYDVLAGPAGFVFARFALSLGVAKEQMGYVLAVVNLACLVQVAGVFLTNAIANKKRLVVGVELAEPLVWIACVFLALLAPPDWRLAALILAAALPAAIMHVIRPTLDEWLASVIPPALRGRFIGRRLQLLNVVVILSQVGAGLLAERIAPGDTLRFALLMVAGGLFGLLAALALNRASLPAATATDTFQVQDLARLLANRPFMRFLIGVVVYNFPVNMACAYYQVFYLQVLGMAESSIAYLMVGYYIVKLATFGLLRRWSDRLGPRRLVLAVAPVYTAFYLFFPLAVPGRIWPLFLAWTLVGVADAGYSIAMNASLYAIVPETSGRKAFFAAYNMVVFAFFALAAFLSARFLVLVRPVDIRIAGAHLDTMYLLFLFSAAMCGICCFYGARFYPESSRALPPQSPSAPRLGSAPHR